MKTTCKDCKEDTGTPFPPKVRNSRDSRLWLGVRLGLCYGLGFGLGKLRLELELGHITLTLGTLVTADPVNGEPYREEQDKNRKKNLAGGLKVTKPGTSCRKLVLLRATAYTL